jgi:predicted ATPase
MRELGETACDVPIQVMGCDASGFNCFHLAEFTAARAYLEQALALYDPTYRLYYSELLSHDALVLSQFHSSLPLACLGHLDQALSRRDAALSEARRLSHPPTLALALGGAVITGSLVRLEPGSVLQHADELLTLGTEHGLGFYRALALTHRGWCLAALGRADEGIPLFTAGVAAMHELGCVAYGPWELALLGDARRMAGQWHAALEHFTEARCLADETEDRYFEAETARLTGEVLLAVDDAAAAEATYEEAIAIARQQSAKLWELRAAISLARLWRGQGRRAEARGMLGPIYGWFTEGFGTPVLREAKALLEELAA